MSRFVLVHGASHGAWCWKKVKPLLAQGGHSVVTPDLPGHGRDKTPISGISLKAYTDRICQVIDEQSESVILVGHSMGGIVITQVAEYRPGKIKKLAYLAAVIPKDGESMRQAIMEIRDPGSVNISEDLSYYTYKDEVIEGLLYDDCSAEDVSFAKSKLVPQPTRPLLEPLRISDENYGNIPRVYIECLKDKTFPPAIQKKMYTRCPCEKVFSMESSHSPFFSAPDILARYLISLV